MTTRAYVLIVFFWAVLTIVTPTLILLSECSKPDFHQKGKVGEGINARKMMAYLEKYPKTPVTPGPMSKESHVAPAPAPAPALEPASETKKLSQN